MLLGLTKDSGNLRETATGLLQASFTKPGNVSLDLLGILQIKQPTFDEIGRDAWPQLFQMRQRGFRWFRFDPSQTFASIQPVGQVEAGKKKNYSGNSSTNHCRT